MYNFDFGVEAACQIGLLPELYEQHIGYKTDGFFVELGAFDGWSWSNTMPLISAGWHGIMVEPDPQNFTLLHQRHGTNKKLTLVNAAICEVSMGTIRLYPGGSSSTIVEGMIDIFRKTPGYATDGMIKTRHIDVVGYKMDDMLALYECPHTFDVLSIDVEGAELLVLDGYDINKHRPKLAIVEGDDDHEHPFLKTIARGVNEYFIRNDYQRIYADHLNTIFVDKRKGGG